MRIWRNALRIMTSHPVRHTRSWTLAANPSGQSERLELSVMHNRSQIRAVEETQGLIFSLVPGKRESGESPV
jgi:hypothetical protein